MSVAPRCFKLFTKVFKTGSWFLIFLLSRTIKATKVEPEAKTTGISIQRKVVAKGFQANSERGNSHRLKMWREGLPDVVSRIHTKVRNRYDGRKGRSIRVNKERYA